MIETSQRLTSDIARESVDVCISAYRSQSLAAAKTRSGRRDAIALFCSRTRSARPPEQDNFLDMCRHYSLSRPDPCHQLDPVIVMVVLLPRSGRLDRYGLAVIRDGQHVALASANGATRPGRGVLPPQPHGPPALQASLTVQDASSS
jgi:hypothetical protein